MINGQPENLEEAFYLYSPVSGRHTNTINELPEEDKEKWIAALLSGEYKQAKAVLCRLDKEGEVVGHCCLGVKAEIEGIESFKDDGCKVYAFPIPGHDYLDRNGGSLNVDWANKHGMYDGKGTFDIEFEMYGEKFYMRTSLAHLNDTGLTFPQIADLIRHFF